MRNNEIAFCIPSYKRSGSQDTLQYLRSIGISANNIYIFTQTSEDYEEYKKYSDDCNLILAPCKTLPQARNNILNHFSEEKNILMMDDDIRMISVGSKEKEFIKIESESDLLRILSQAFKISSEKRGAMFGFYPVYNNFFMSNTFDYKKPVNTILGFPKGFQLRFNETFVAKEDLELCGRIIASGGNVIRFNNVAFIAKHRTNDGGAKELWKSGVNKEYAYLLEIMYPEVYKVQKNNPEEVRALSCEGKKGKLKWI